MVKTCQLIPNQWNFISVTQRQFDLFFATTSKTTKEIFAKFVDTDLDLKVHALHYANELLILVSLSFQKVVYSKLL